MEFSIYTVAIYSTVRMVHWGVTGYDFKRILIFLSKHQLVSAKSAYPNEMPHIQQFHMGLHCLPEYPFMEV